MLVLEMPRQHPPRTASLHSTQLNTRYTDGMDQTSHLTLHYYPAGDLTALRVDGFGSNTSACTTPLVPCQLTHPDE
jgi:hypothetical protein